MSERLNVGVIGFGRENWCPNCGSGKTRAVETSADRDLYQCTRCRAEHVREKGGKLVTEADGV